MLSYLWTKDPKILNYHPMPTKTEVTKGRWGGRWREGEGRRGRERKKEPKRKKERKKTRLQPDKSRDCRIFRQAGCYSYGDWSTKSWNRKGVYRVWWGHELTTHLWTSVNFAGLGSYISLLGFLTNYFKTPFTRAQKIGTTRQIVGTVPRLPVPRLPPGR